MQFSFSLGQSVEKTSKYLDLEDLIQSEIGRGGGGIKYISLYNVPQVTLTQFHLGHIHSTEVKLTAVSFN